jgi:hypothetical protein
MNLRKILGPNLALVLLIGITAAISKSVREERQAQLAAKSHIIVRILAGPEKEHLFEDVELNRVLESKGISFVFQKAGVREMANQADLKNFDVAFPAGEQATVKIAQEAGAKRVYTAFYSPIAIASWRSLVPVLERNGLVSQHNGAYFIGDMERLLALMEKGERWKDLPGNTAYPASKSILITCADVRQTNSGAMYLALASYLANGSNVVESDADANRVAARMVTLFSRQGFQELSSTGPFEDYTAMGIGKAPLVMIYEQQFLEYLLSHPAPNPDMVLLYPQPTILSKHSIIALDDKGARFAEEMISDPKVISIAQRYGFRTPDSSQLFAAVEAKKLAIPHTIVDVIDPPTYDILEKLINKVDDGLKQ